MSAPETKALPPAPDITTTRIAGSRAKSSMMVSALSHISSETALWRAGLLNTMRPKAPSLVISILSVIIEDSVFDACARSDGAALFQSLDGGRVVAELAQDLVGMLARGRRLHDEMARRPAQLHRLSREVDGAAQLRLEALDHLEMVP